MEQFKEADNGNNNIDNNIDAGGFSTAKEEDGSFCVASEMCTFLWPESTFFGEAYPTLEKLLLDYHDIEEQVETKEQV